MGTTNFFLPALALMALLGATGCDAMEPATKSGDLGNGRFRYVCVNGSDIACLGGEPPVSFPSVIAVGAEFGVEYLPWSKSTPTGRIEPVSPAFVTETSRGFRVMRAGTDGLLARSTEDGHVIDFTHVTFRAPAKLRFSSEDDAPARKFLKVGDEMTIYARPVSHDGEDLDGAISCAWMSSDEGVVALMLDGETPTMGLRAMAAGKATISASTSGLVSTAPTTLEITVEP